MKQLALEISPPPQPTLENFVPGANAELLARLRDFRAGTFAEAVLYLWGAPGSGKSHLLCSIPGCTFRCAEESRRLRWLA